MINNTKLYLGLLSLLPLMIQADEVFVYPAKGQSAEQQKADQGQCAAWAKEQTGFDPLNPPTIEVAPVQDKSGGAAAKGVARGAIVGSVVGKATNLKRTESAAAGAVIGGVRSGRTKEAQQQAQSDQARKQAEAGVAKQGGNYNRAYKTCLEGRGYTAK
jgi:hypothetical protein